MASRVRPSSCFVWAAVGGAEDCVRVCFLTKGGHFNRWTDYFFELEVPLEYVFASLLSLFSHSVEVGVSFEYDIFALLSIQGCTTTVA